MQTINPVIINTDSVIREFFQRIDELRNGNSGYAGNPAPDMTMVGKALTDLAADKDYFAQYIAGMPAGQQGAAFIHTPPTGPRLIMVHRPRGVMSYTHSHHVWLALAPVQGVETHQHMNASRRPNGTADIRLASETQLHTGQTFTLIPPGDVHTHGHKLGTGPVPYTLILLGDDMLRVHREEYSLTNSTWRDLVPRDAGTLNRPVPSMSDNHVMAGMAS